MPGSRRLLNFNRVIILALVALGLLSDGFQSGDVYFLLSSILWIWLPRCIKIETVIIKHVKSSSDHS